MEFAAPCDLFCSADGRDEEEDDSLSALEEVSGLLFSQLPEFDAAEEEELARDLVGLNAGIVFTSFLFWNGCQLSWQTKQEWEGRSEEKGGKEGGREGCCCCDRNLLIEHGMNVLIGFTCQQSKYDNEIH